MYLIANISNLTVLQTLPIPINDNVVGLTYILESIALVVGRAGGIQKYTLTNTTVTFALVLL
jgi:hypothetical protein